MSDVKAGEGDMSETTEGERTDERESAQFNSLDGLTSLFASPAPSTAGSIDSREEVHDCDDWDLFSDAALDQHEASDNSTDDHSDEEDDQPGDSDLHQAAIEQDDTDRLANHCSTTTASADTSVHRRIQVVVRVRLPLNSEDKIVVTAGEKEGVSLCVQAITSQGTSSTVTECTFDRVFMGDATQEDVFAAIEPSVQACLEGYNATVFAYGQTGTGKTHTLFGRDLDSSRDSTEWGLVPRTLSYLLGQAAILKHKNCQVELHLSFLQIYNDRLFDLLTDRMRQKPLLLREQPMIDGTTSVIIRGLSSEKISSFSNAMQIIHQGHTNRCVRETESNLSSSRSHAIVQVNITTQCPALNGEGQVVRRARLNLVDLAGSEKWNTDVQMEDAHSQELKTINTSLSALGNCIAALTETGRKHIPYRDSTLTRVLQDSFGGNTLSCLIATINATQQACDETIRTLQFADRARSVMQTIRVNEVVDGSTELLMAKIQIVKLRERLESEQRRRHEIRVKEHQTLQEILKGKDKEITKLTRDNVVFQRWREEDVKKIRALESRVKDLEQQIDTNDSKSIENVTVTQGSKRQSSSIPAVRKSRSRKNLTRAGRDNGTAGRAYKQVLERYALSSSKDPQVKETQSNKSASDQSDSAHDATNQVEDPAESQPAPPDMKPLMNQNPCWGALDESRVGEAPVIGKTRQQGSGLRVSPVLYQPNEPTLFLALTKNSSTYSSSAASFCTEWTPSIQASKSMPTILTQHQESIKKHANPSPVNGYSSSVQRQETFPLVKNASTGSIAYSPPVRVPIISTMTDVCLKHKLAGCMLCSVGGGCRPTQVPSRQPTKEFTTSSMTSNSPEMARKSQDGSCAKHQLLRCFICSKGSTVCSITKATVTSTAASTYTYSQPASSANLSYQGDTQSKCALHSLANCILCAGVKAMTRKVAVPSPKASPVKVNASFDARSAIHVEERDLDRYRRYTLDERILNYKAQPKLANHW
ncbi:hypothetical protein PPTG_01012 [Phytophthora nicotianae INRA-310]|uniref:Kinesin-like protein n=3 Tax=Phytophthora nicotianae TaxID=4792 RepID=W2RHE2_PHYN3|nr:hypothetical protein PPTG_01012 [Phytophthora nicotianae INRA-310]ETM55705.1 hypothetical protein L914_01117 [Phytophthora nicotianae]ETN24823.1 hypothetical protein PPTG_01012 [Phytophthora nicotianae INRA-310]